MVDFSASHVRFFVGDIPFEAMNLQAAKLPACCKVSIFSCKIREALPPVTSRTKPPRRRCADCFKSTTRESCEKNGGVVFAGECETAGPTTPEDERLELENIGPLEKEIHLPNSSLLGSMLIFGGCR